MPALGRQALLRFGAAQWLPTMAVSNYGLTLHPHTGVLVTIQLAPKSHKIGRAGRQVFLSCSTADMCHIFSNCCFGSGLRDLVRITRPHDDIGLLLLLKTPTRLASHGCAPP